MILPHMSSLDEDFFRACQIKVYFYSQQNVGFLSFPQRFCQIKTYFLRSTECWVSVFSKEISCPNPFPKH